MTISERLIAAGWPVNEGLDFLQLVSQSATCDKTLGAVLYRMEMDDEYHVIQFINICRELSPGVKPHILEKFNELISKRKD